MEKVDEPKIEETWQCPRCNQDYCGDCVNKHEIDFNIKDAPDGFNRRETAWEGLLVCPWCYNQLLDKLMPTTESEEKKQ